MSCDGKKDFNKEVRSHFHRQWRRGLTLILLGVAVVTSPLRAQEVTVGEPVWLLPGPAPDELPKLKHPLKPDYPKDLRKTEEMGYVVVIRYVDSSGQSLLLSAHGTHIPFQRSVEAEFNDWKIAPARRGGKPVDAEFWMPIIFNPKIAVGDGPDGGPRLLAVQPVFLPNNPASGNLPPTVRMRLNLDATGVVIRTEPEDKVPGKLLEDVNAALKSWRFAPARRSGQSVAAEIAIPVLICQPPVLGPAAKQIPPRPISRADPQYPYVMQRFGIQGHVVVEFVVDATGVVRNPVIVASDNPAFDEAAMEAILKWKFQPATVGGRNVNTLARQTIVFQMDFGGNDTFRITGHADQSKLPPELRFDTPPKILGVQIPVYPYAQRRDDTRGKAEATMLIDGQGRVTAVKVRQADRPEFGLALTAALEGFTFDPALKDGKPGPCLLNFEQVFSSRELPDGESDHLLWLEKKQPDNIVGARMLDVPPKPISRRPPVFPRGLEKTVTSGEAVIECLIDERGRVRLPRIAQASDPAFGYAAVQAVASWWFEPPRKDGKPVVTRVQIPFAFKQESLPATTAKPN